MGGVFNDIEGPLQKLHNVILFDQKRSSGERHSKGHLAVGMHFNEAINEA